MPTVLNAGREEVPLADETGKGLYAEGGESSPAPLDLLAGHFGVAEDADQPDWQKPYAFWWQSFLNNTPEGAIARAGVRSLMENHYPATPGFDPWKQELPPDLEGDRGRFSDVRSPERFQARADQVRQDRSDAEILADHPVLAMGAAVAMGGLSPVSLVGAGARAVGAAKTAAAVSRATRVLTPALELGRQAAQGAFDPLATLGVVGGTALHATAAGTAFRDADPAAVGAAGRAADAVHASAEADAAALARAAEERAAGGSPGAVARGPAPFGETAPGDDGEGPIIVLDSAPTAGMMFGHDGRQIQNRTMADPDRYVPSSQRESGHGDDLSAPPKDGRLVIGPDGLAYANHAALRDGEGGVPVPPEDRVPVTVERERQLWSRLPLDEVSAWRKARLEGSPATSDDQDAAYPSAGAAGAGGEPPPAGRASPAPPGLRRVLMDGEEFLVDQDGNVVDTSVDPDPGGDGQARPAASGDGGVPFPSAGAAGAEGARYRPSDERLVPMGGMENLGLTPFLRLMAGPVEDLLPDVAALVSHPFAQVKNTLGLASEISVEQRARAWSMDAARTSLETGRLFDEYRGIAAETPAREAAAIRVKDAVDGLTGGRPGLSFRQFREAVGDAMNDGDRHDIPQVQAAAQKWRQLANRLDAEGSDVGIYGQGAERQGVMVRAQIRQLEDRIEELDGQVSRGEAPAGWQKYVREIDQTLERLRARAEILDGQPEGGKGIGEGRSYFPQMPRIDRMLAEPEAMKDLLRRLFRRGGLPKARGIEDGRPLERQVEDVYTEMTQRGDWRPLNDDPDVVGLASAARERMLQWPADLWQEAKRFYDMDVDRAMRHHARTLGTDVELTKRYGSVEMHDQLGHIDDWAKGEVDKLMPKGTYKGAEGEPVGLPLTPQAKAKLDEIGARARSMKDDLRSLRDKVRGTYGLPADPYRWQSRTIRAAKQFNNLTKLGLATFSAFADAGRPIMVEGLDRTFRAGIVPLWRAVEDLALRKPGAGRTVGLWAREARLAHAATEAMTGKLAMRFSDPADSFGRRSSWERMMARGNAAAFMASGIDTWTQHIKEWAGMIAGSRMLDDIHAWGGGGELSAKKLQALARVGIDQGTARQIAEHLEAHGERSPEGLWLPNTERWVGGDGHLDTQSVWAFRHALANEVDRTVVTPSAADRPNWMSTEMGGLIGQYRTFGLSNFQRILMAGMQDPDKGSFVHGAVAMVGLGMIADRLRELAKGEDRRKPYMQRLADGVDRSGVLGFVSDLNNLVEAGTGNRLGLRPLVGAEKPYKAGWPYTLGQVGGPAVGTAFDVGQAVKGAFTPGHVDGTTAHALRNLMVGNNNVFLYRAFNGLQKELTDRNGARARGSRPPPEDPGLPLGTGA